MTAVCLLYDCYMTTLCDYSMTTLRLLYDYSMNTVNPIILNRGSHNSTAVPNYNNRNSIFNSNI